MSYAKHWAGATALLLGTLCAGARAESPVAGRDPAGFSLAPSSGGAAGEPAYLAAAPAGRARRPLMSLLDQTGVGRWLDQNRIEIFGYAEGSYTYNPGRPAGHFNSVRLFDYKNEDLLLNQVDVAVEREVDFNSRKLDWGFRIEEMFGTDAQTIHSNGLDFHADPPAPASSGPHEQFDIPQAYVDLLVPVGSGLRLRFGKFEGFFGGSYNPNNSLFYSRTLIFASAHPFTFTGVLGTYNVNDRMKIDLGFSRGWEQSLKDNNDAIDVLGRVSYQLSDRLSGSVAAVVGPEQRNDNSHYRTLIDAVLRFKASERLSFILDAEYGYQGGATLAGGELPASLVAGTSLSQFARGKFAAIPAETAGALGIGSGLRKDAHFYGLTGYASYALSKHFTVNYRAEWFRDDGGYFTTASGNYYETTLGVAIKPFADSALGSNFVVRPEVRYDKADRRIFDDGTHLQQFTAAVDAIFKF